MTTIRQYQLFRYGLVSIWLALIYAPPIAAQCQYSIPHGVGAVLDLEKFGTLGFTRPIRVINVYWGGNNWNGIPAHSAFHKEDIDAATRELFATDYFEKLCQYGGPSGGPNVTLLASTDTGQALNPCLPHVPQNNFTAADVFQFVSCEEGMEFTDVPHTQGTPSHSLPGMTGLACMLCGVSPLPCYLDGVCLLVPNPTGDLLINVFPPRDKHFGGTGGCDKMDGYHYQVPSNAIGYPVLPLAFTQGRPIYFTFIRTECFETIDRMMGTLSHEIVEALSDPYPGAFWYDTSHGQTGANGEAADVCDKLTKNGDYDPAGGFRSHATLTWKDARQVARSMEVAYWWSNYDHDCIASLKLPTPATPKDRCQGILDAIDNLQATIQSLEEQLKDATGQQRTVIQTRIKTTNQQIQTEQQAFSRCRANKQ